MRFLVYMYYTHLGYLICIFGKNCVYYIRIFTVMQNSGLRHQSFLHG